MQGYDAEEEEFRAKCIEISMYESCEMTTLDNEWTESELSDGVYDVCSITMTDNLLDKYKHRALADRNLLLMQYMAEKITSENDLIDIYNREYGKNNDGKTFGIIWFDNKIKKMIKSILDGNIVK